MLKGPEVGLGQRGERVYDLFVQCYAAVRRQAASARS